MNIQGDATKARTYAAIIDNILALATMAALVSLIGAYLPSFAIVVIATGYLGYFFLTEGLWGRTVCKFTQGLIVRRVDGSHAGWKEAFIRSLLRLLETNPAFFGGLPAGLIVIASDQNQRLGDIAAGTVVVSDKIIWKGEKDIVEGEPAV